MSPARKRRLVNAHRSILLAAAVGKRRPSGRLGPLRGKGHQQSAHDGVKRFVGQLNDGLVTLFVYS